MRWPKDVKPANQGLSWDGSVFGDGIWVPRVFSASIARRTATLIGVSVGLIAGVIPDGLSNHAWRTAPLDWVLKTKPLNGGARCPSCGGQAPTRLRAFCLTLSVLRSQPSPKASVGAGSRSTALYSCVAHLRLAVVGGVPSPRDRSSPPGRAVRAPRPQGSHRQSTDVPFLTSRLSDGASGARRGGRGRRRRGLRRWWRVRGWGGFRGRTSRCGCRRPRWW